MEFKYSSGRDLKAEDFGMWKYCYFRSISAYLFQRQNLFSRILVQVLDSGYASTQNVLKSYLKLLNIMDVVQWFGELWGDGKEIAIFSHSKNLPLQNLFLSRVRWISCSMAGFSNQSDTCKNTDTQRRMTEKRWNVEPEFHPISPPLFFSSLKLFFVKIFILWI
jgi:hypothetical protein